MISESLKQTIAQAQITLEADALGHLPLPNRKAIWRQLGPTMPQIASPLADGVLRRGALAFLTVSRVLPIWRSAIGTREIEDGLAAGSMFARQEINREQAYQALKDLWASAEEVLPRGEKFLRASYVASAASSAIASLISDADYPKSNNESEQDEDRDPYEWDASLYACMALTDDVWADPPAHVEERRSFWKWYIQEDTPNAYNNFRVILRMR